MNTMIHRFAPRIAPLSALATKPKAEQYALRRAPAPTPPPMAECLQRFHALRGATPLLTYTLPVFYAHVVPAPGWIQVLPQHITLYPFRHMRSHVAADFGAFEPYVTHQARLIETFLLPTQRFIGDMLLSDSHDEAIYLALQSKAFEEWPYFHRVYVFCRLGKGASFIDQRQPSAARWYLENQYGYQPHVNIKTFLELHGSPHYSPAAAVEEVIRKMNVYLARELRQPFFTGADYARESRLNPTQILPLATIAENYPKAMSEAGIKDLLMIWPLAWALQSLARRSIPNKPPFALGHDSTLANTHAEMIAYAVDQVILQTIAGSRHTEQWLHRAELLLDRITALAANPTDLTKPPRL